MQKMLDEIRLGRVSLLVTVMIVSLFGSTADAKPVPDDLALYRATQDVFRAAAVKVRPYIVRIDTVGGAQPRKRLPVPGDKKEGRPELPPQPFQEDAGSGFRIADGPTTGIVYAADGYIITSSFNFVREPLLISVTLADGRRLAGDLIARDQVRKLALLKIDADDLPVPPWRPRESIHVGEWAIALGLGFGGTEPAVNVGIVSALSRMMGNAVQTDAKLSPANYGGPLCDIEGRVLGISIPMAQRPGELAGTEMYDCGIGFILPKDRVDDIVSVLMTGRSFYRGWLGISVSQSPAGLYVNKVADPSPMLDAAVISGDRIVAVNDKRISHYGQLVQALYLVPAGEEVVIQLERDETFFNAAVKLARNTDLGSLPDDEEPFDPSTPSSENDTEEN